MEVVTKYGGRGIIYDLHHASKALLRLIKLLEFEQFEFKKLKIIYVIYIIRVVLFHSAIQIRFLFYRFFLNL